MKKKQLCIAVLTGLVVGQLFADGNRPFTVANTLRFGYDDNLYRESSNEEESAYIQDIVDLSFRAALSDRTDLIFKSRFEYRTDKESNFYPNLYAVLTHSVSPRLLLQLSDKYRSGTRTSRFAQGRYNYFENTLAFTPSYVLSEKDSLSAPMSYKIVRNDGGLDLEDLDMITAGLTWKRDLIPQRTWAALSLNQAMVDYINRDSTYDSTRVTAELSHTFTPKWNGSLGAGLSYDQTDSRDYLTGTNETSEGVNPYVAAGLTYTPSPRTRFTANVSQQYKESDNRAYAAGTVRAVQFGAQHDFTARIKGKLTARFKKSEFDQQDNTNGNVDANEDRFDMDFRLSYTLNRANFLEMGLKHSEMDYDVAGRDWEQNMIDLGWRVEL